MKYWAEDPPTHVLLALRYLGERKKTPMSESQMQGKAQELGAMMGGGVEQAPDGFADIVAWVEEKKTKLKGRHG